MPPRNVIAIANTTSITLSLIPPLNTSQNGPITNYVVLLIGMPFISPPFFVYNITPVYPATRRVMFKVTGLEEYNNYTFAVAANNSLMGVSTTDLFITTLQAGKLISGLSRLLRIDYDYNYSMY